MLSGVLALLERSLRVDSRAWTPHIARFGLMATIYIAICHSVVTGWRFGAPGLRFFQCIAYLNLIFITLIGIGFFSTAISEEKEEDTLGLMLMAGISPLGILLGKAGGRLLQALLLIAVQYPFTLLAVTMGGVTQTQVRAVYVAMTSYMILLAGLGLLTSTLASRNRTASMRLTVCVTAYFVVPAYCAWLLSNGVTFGVFAKSLEWISESCVFLQMGTILTSGFHDPLFSRQVMTNGLIGLLSFLLAWTFFGLALRDRTSSSPLPNLRIRSARYIRVFAAGRPRLDPFIWKDFHFVAGGRAALLFRVLIYLAILPISILLAETIFAVGTGINTMKGPMSIFFILSSFVMSIDAGMLVSRSLHEEFQGQTVAALVLLPTSLIAILYRKIAGTLMVWLPGPIFVYLIMAGTVGGREAIRDFINFPGPSLMLVTHLFLVPHAAALAALFVRWGALGVGMAMVVVTGFLTALFISAFNIPPTGTKVHLLGIAIVALSIPYHIAILLRAERLSTK